MRGRTGFFGCHVCTGRAGWLTAGNAGRRYQAHATNAAVDRYISAGNVGLLGNHHTVTGWQECPLPADFHSGMPGLSWLIGNHFFHGDLDLVVFSSYYQDRN